MEVTLLLRVAAVSLALTLTPAAATAATKKPRKPVGGLKLTVPHTLAKGPRGLACGKVGRAWLAGRIVKGGWFLSFRQEAANLRTQARATRGPKTRRALRRKAAVAAERETAFHAGCQRFTYTPPSALPASLPAPWVAPDVPAPVEPPPPAPAEPVRVDLTGAVGVARSATPTGGRSNLVAVDTRGRTRDAVVAGTATASQVLVGPDGTVYVLFERPVRLDVNTDDPCLFARVDPARPVPTCVDPGLDALQWPESPQRNPAIQFDDRGAVYYLGIAGGRSVLRRSGATTTDLTHENVTVSDFLVMPDGTTLLTGDTISTRSPWARRLGTDGTLSALPFPYWYFARRFPDGKVYAGVSSNPYFGVVRFDAAAPSALESWIADSRMSDVTPVHDVAPYCGQGDFYSRLCGGTSVIGRSFVTDDDQVYVLVGSTPRATFARYAPTLELPPVGVDRVSLATGDGRRIVLAGLDAQDRNVLGVFDTRTGSYRALLDPAQEIEIYNAAIAADGRTLLFDGLRFADNTFVTGLVDLDSGDTTMAPGQRLVDLQALR